MESWQIYALGLIAVALVGLFAGLLRHKGHFDAAMLGLLTLPIAIVLIIVINPDSIKVGDVELKKLKKDAREVIEQSRQSNLQAQEAIAEANKSLKLAVETSAMVAWNSGRSAQSKEAAEQQADLLLKRIYGDDALKYRMYLQREGIFDATIRERAQVKDVMKPAWIESPLLETLKRPQRAEPAMKK